MSNIIDITADLDDLQGTQFWPEGGERYNFRAGLGADYGEAEAPHQTTAYHLGLRGGKGLAQALTPGPSKAALANVAEARKAHQASRDAVAFGVKSAQMLRGRGATGGWKNVVGPTLPGQEHTRRLIPRRLGKEAAKHAGIRTRTALEVLKGTAEAADDAAKAPKGAAAVERAAKDMRQARLNNSARIRMARKLGVSAEALAAGTPQGHEKLHYWKTRRDYVDAREKGMRQRLKAGKLRAKVKEAARTTLGGNPSIPTDKPRAYRLASKVWRSPAVRVAGKVGGKLLGPLAYAPEAWDLTTDFMGETQKFADESAQRGFFGRVGQAAMNPVTATATMLRGLAENPEHRRVQREQSLIGQELDRKREALDRRRMEAIRQNEEVMRKNSEQRLQIEQLRSPSDYT
jgi:hypothetical protein